MQYLAAIESFQPCTLSAQKYAVIFVPMVNNRRLKLGVHIYICSLKLQN